MVYGTVFILMRLLHVGSAVMALGALALIVLCAGPARALIEQSEAVAVIRRIEKRIRLVLALSMLGLIVSGVYQWVIFGQAYQKMGPVALGLISVKIALAAAFFTFLWAMHVELMVHPKARGWRLTNLLLCIGVVMLAGVLRYVRLRHMGL